MTNYPAMFERCPLPPTPNDFALAGDEAVELPIKSSMIAILFRQFVIRTSSFVLLFCRLSGIHLKAPVLTEMSIEGKCGFYAQTLHQDKTGAVSEAELVIRKCLEDVPGGFDGFGLHILDADKSAGSKRFAELNGNRMSGPHPNNRVGLIQDIITGYERLPLFETGTLIGQSLRMMGVPEVLDGQECGRVNEDHLPSLSS